MNNDRRRFEEARPYRKPTIRRDGKFLYLPWKITTYDRSIWVVSFSKALARLAHYYRYGE